MFIYKTSFANVRIIRLRDPVKMYSAADEVIKRRAPTVICVYAQPVNSLEYTYILGTAISNFCCIWGVAQEVCVCVKESDEIPTERNLCSHLRFRVLPAEYSR